MIGVNHGGKFKLNDQVHVGRKGQEYVLVDGDQVPVKRYYGKTDMEKNPWFRTMIAKLGIKIANKLGAPVDSRFVGTESVRVEKMDEVYVKGRGENAVHNLTQLGYGYRDIARKIGRNVLKEINVHHTVRDLKIGHTNEMLNEGIDKIWDLIVAGTSSELYSNGNSRVGVGNGTTAAAATQTGLAGGSTTFASMVSGYPLTSSAQRIDFKGSFGNGLAEHEWREFTVDNGSSNNHNLQRILANKGTKESGEIWTSEIRITGS